MDALRALLRDAARLRAQRADLLDGLLFLARIITFALRSLSLEEEEAASLEGEE